MRRTELDYQCQVLLKAESNGLSPEEQKIYQEGMTSLVGAEIWVAGRNSISSTKRGIDQIGHDVSSSYFDWRAPEENFFSQQFIPEVEKNLGHTFEWLANLHKQLDELVKSSPNVKPAFNSAFAAYMPAIRSLFQVWKTKAEEVINQSYINITEPEVKRDWRGEKEYSKQTRLTWQHNQKIAQNTLKLLAKYTGNFISSLAFG